MQIFTTMGSSKHHVYDAFISHAVEDKIPFADELWARLKDAGLNVWYSGGELKVGDNLAASIEAGMNASRFGIVVLSPAYIASHWTMKEFHALQALEKQQSGKVILPVLYEITPEQLAVVDLTMAEKWSVRADKGMEAVVEQLLGEIRKLRALEYAEAGKTRWPRRAFVAAAIVAAALPGGFFFIGSTRDTHALTEAVIRREIQNLVDESNRNADALLKDAGPVQKGSADDVIARYTRYRAVKSRYRNEYRLLSGNSKIEHKKNVEAAMGIDLDTLSPLNFYGLTAPGIFYSDGTGQTRLIFVNTHPVVFELTSPVQTADGVYTVNVSYRENVRLVQTVLVFPPETRGTSADERKKYQVTIVGTVPTERVHFRNTDGRWLASRESR